MKLIYVCSPCRGIPPYDPDKTRQNQVDAGEYCREVINAGHIPIAPHYFYGDILNDKISEQRAKALELGIILLSKCDALWVFGKTISAGMKTEIARAKVFGIPVLYRN